MDLPVSLGFVVTCFAMAIVFIFVRLVGVASFFLYHLGCVEHVMQAMVHQLDESKRCANRDAVQCPYQQTRWKRLQ